MLVMRALQTISLLLALLTSSTCTGQEGRQERDPRRQQMPFRTVFSIRGVELSAEQQGKVDKIRKTRTPMLLDYQQQLNRVYSDKQRKDRQQAFRKAQNDGKNAQEVRGTADAAANLTSEQKKQLASIRKDRADLVSKIQTELRALLTEKQRVATARPRNRNNQPAGTVLPTYADLKYGPYGRNVMDVWLAKSEKPTPVSVSIHGGGFRGGNKGNSRTTRRSDSIQMTGAATQKTVTKDGSSKSL